MINQPLNNTSHNLLHLNLRVVKTIVSIIVIIMVLLAINIAIFKHASDLRDAEINLERINDEINQLNNLEWEVMGSGHSPEITKLNEIYDKQRLVSGYIHHLEEGSIEITHLKDLSEAFEKYTKSANLMFDLLLQGNRKQAHIADDNNVDPSFEYLNKVISNTLREHRNSEGFRHKLSFVGQIIITTIAFGWIFILIRRLQTIRGYIVTSDSNFAQIQYIFDVSHDGICIIDTNFNIILTNATFDRMFGKSAGKKCYESCFSNLCETEKCPLRVISSGANFVEEIVEKTERNGSVIYYSVTAAPYLDSNGKLIGIVENYKDITERRKTAEMLRRYKLFSQHARDIILFVNMEGKIIEANNSAIEIYGYSYGELLGMEITDLRHPEHRESISYQMETADKNGVTFETVHITKDGHALPVEVSSTSADFGNQRILVSIIRDITERKNAEKLIVDQKEFAENLVLNLTIPAFVIDRNHNVTIWNKACEELTGITKDEVLGTKEHWKAFYKTPTPCLSDAVIDSSDKDLPHQYKYLNPSAIISEGLHAEAWFENINGRKRYLIIEAAPIYDDNRNLVAVIETLQDLTDHKKAQESILKYNDKLCKELELASTIQKNLLPQKPPNISNLQFAWKFEPSVYVAGDMFDIFSLDHHHVGFYILDVKGHGISAALNAVTLNHLLRPSNYNDGYFGFSDNRNFPLPSQVLKKLNDYFTEGTINNFFTIFYGVINTSSSVMTYAKAGHCPPVLVSDGGNAEVLNSEGVAVGMLKNASYYDCEIQLKAGDKVVLYSDGVMETDSVVDKPFLVEDLADLISRSCNLSISEIVELVVSETRNRTRDLETKDDITVVGFQVS